MNLFLKQSIFIALTVLLAVILCISLYLESDINGFRILSSSEIQQIIAPCEAVKNEKGTKIFGKLTLHSYPAPYDREKNCFYIPQSLSPDSGQMDVHWSNQFAKIYLVSDSPFDKLSSIASGESFQLYIVANKQYYQTNVCFTGLPAIVIQSSEKAEFLYSDPERDRDGKFLYFFDPSGKNGYETLSCGASVSDRGAQTMEYAKPQYRLDLFSQDQKPLSISILGLARSETLLLSAQEYESSKVRDAVARDVWNALCLEGTRGNFATPAIQFCEVFEDERYLGLYGIMERSPINVNNFYPEDALIKLKVMGLQSEVEKKYETNPDSMVGWTYLNQFSGRATPLFHLRDYYSALCANPAGELLNSFYEENIIDYFLYLNCISGIDNELSNCFFYQPISDQNLSRFYRIPWDLDRSFGHPFGDVIDLDPTLSDQTIITKEMEQLLATDDGRLWEAICERWFALRQSCFSEDYITGQMVERITLLSKSGAYQRDFDVWGNPGGRFDLSQLLAYTANHLSFLDAVFSQSTSEQLFQYRYVRLLNW